MFLNTFKVVICFVFSAFCRGLTVIKNCKSKKNKFKKCKVANSQYRVTSVQVLKVKSSAGCVYFPGLPIDFFDFYGAYGYYDNFIWVINNCKGQLQVCVERKYENTCNDNNSDDTNRLNEPRHEKTGFLHMRKQRRRPAQLISALVFASHIIQSFFFLNTKYQVSSHLLWLYSPVFVGPGRKPRRPVFSERGSNNIDGVPPSAFRCSSTPMETGSIGDCVET